MNEHNNICRRLNWDSEFFGCNIARLSVEHLTGATAAEAFAWCEQNDIDCLYFLADPNDPETVKSAEVHGFQLTDVRLTLERELKELSTASPIPCVIRLGTATDAPLLGQIASQSHRDSRFYYDSHFSKSRCDALYKTWLEKSLNGYAEAVLVAEVQGELAGYLSCHLSSQTEGQIGLFAVESSARGKGIGRGLLYESFRWFSSRGASVVTVVTQGRNVAGQRLYQGCGFTTRAMQFWYHRWFEDHGRD